jgi:thioredoxin 1
MQKVLITFILILALAACGAGTDKPAETNASEQGVAPLVENTVIAEADQSAEAQNASPEPAAAQTRQVAANPSPAPKTDSPQPKQGKEGYKVTFLEIGAESCIPCRMMQPIMKEIAEEYPGVVEVIFHDLYEDREIGQKYRIRVMPTQVFLDASGREFFRHEGFYPKDQMKAMLDKYLATLD